MNIGIDLYNIYFFTFITFIGLALWCVWQIAAADWRRRIIPDVYLFPLLLIGIIISTFFPWISTIEESIIAASAGYLLALLIGWGFDKLQNKKGKKSEYSPIGMGDVKLIAVGGIWLGTIGLAGALVIACIAGIIWGRIKKQKYIPFAPFFISGGILSLIAIAFLL